jgi:hypothetical protein
MEYPFQPGDRIMIHWAESNSSMTVDVVQSKSPDRPDDLWIPLGDQWVQFWDADTRAYSPLFAAADRIVQVLT